MILLGLVIGVIGTVNVMNALSERNPMPRAVMHTLGYHMGELGRAIKAKQCTAVMASEHLQRIQSTANDIMPVFKIDEKEFSSAATDLQNRTQQALQSVPGDCAALAAAIKPINQACKSCHDKYR